MGYFVGIIFIAFGIHVLSTDISSFQAWFSFLIGILSIAFTINKPMKEKSKGKGDGYRSGTSDYTSGGDSGGGGD
jgi:uncharacterized membrane protein YgcG